MALHAKLQLSAGLWRAPLWPVVLSLCDWLTGRGGVETPSFFPPFAPSLALAFPPSRLLNCSARHLDQAVMSTCVFWSVWHNRSSFSGGSHGPLLALDFQGEERNHRLAVYSSVMQIFLQNLLLGEAYWCVFILSFLSPLDQLLLTHVALQHTDAAGMCVTQMWVW